MSVIDNRNSIADQAAPTAMRRIPSDAMTSGIDANLIAVYEKAGIPVFLDPKTGDVDLPALDRELKRLS